MSKLLITIGGSASRVATAAVYSIGAGLLDEHGKLQIMRVDKDTANGTTAAFDDVVSHYQNFVKFLGVEDKRSFARYDFSPNQWTMESLLRRDNDSPVNKLVKGQSDSYDLLYDSKEQGRQLTEGFERHPNIGALIFEQMKVDNRFSTQIDEVLEGAKNNGHAEIFIVGSIFGGTGASMFSNLAEYIRGKALQIEGINQRVHIGGVLLLPYFSIPRLNPDQVQKLEDEGEYVISDQDFLEASQKALQYYHKVPNLLRAADNADMAIFDALYLAGYTPFCEIKSNGSKAEYAKGGKDQKSDCSLVDLYAATAMCHFFANSLSDKSDFKIPEESGQHNLYIAQLSSNPGNLTTIGWENLPQNTDDRLLQTLRFALFITTNLYAEYLTCRKKKDCLYCAVLTTGNEKTDGLEAAYTFCRGFLSFMLQVASTNVDGTHLCSLLDTEPLEKIIASLDALKGGGLDKQKVREQLRVLENNTAAFLPKNNGLTATANAAVEPRKLVPYDAKTLEELLQVRFDKKANKAESERYLLDFIYEQCALDLSAAGR